MTDFPQPYWSEWADRIIGQFNLKRHGNGAQAEWHGGCPCCGGVDRFWIKERDAEVKAFCRQGCTITDISKALTEAGCWPSNKGDNVLSFKAAITAEDFAGGIMVPYHERKQVDLLGAKLVGDNVVVSIFDIHKNKVGTQTIKPNGKKKFNGGMSKKGSFAVTRKITGGFAYIAEGWATAASVTMATNEACVISLDCHNLPNVVEVFKEHKPHIELVVAADNDKKGIEAAKKSGCRWAVPNEKDADWNDVWVSQGAKSVQQGLALAKHTAGLFTHVSDIEMQPPRWLIDGMLEQESLTMCFGSPAAGKTFAVLDMALSIAAGKSYHGKAVEQGMVLYIAGEGHAGFARRVAAWSQTHDVPLGKVPFYKSNNAIIMNDEAAATEVVAEIDALVERAGQAPKLVVLDTLARTMIGDENSSEKVGEYIKALDEIKVKYGSTVLVVHHTGHGNKDRARGSSVMFGALDAEFRVETWGETKVLITPTKMKDAEEPEPMAFLRVTVPLTTPNGEETSSLVLEYTADKPRNKKDPEYQKEVIVDQLRRLNDFMEAPRRELKEAVALELEIGQRQADRAIKRLIDQGALSCTGGIVKGA